MYKKTSITNYYQIQSWMVNDPNLQLKYPARDVYAILYGFTQDPNQWVEPTQAYIAELIGCSRQAVNTNITKLEEMGLIRKRTEKHPRYGYKTYYQAIVPELTPCQPARQGGVNAIDKGSQWVRQGDVNPVDKGYQPGRQRISKNIRMKNNKDNKGRELTQNNDSQNEDFQERVKKLKQSLKEKYGPNKN